MINPDVESKINEIIARLPAKYQALAERALREEIERERQGQHANDGSEVRTWYPAESATEFVVPAVARRQCGDRTYLLLSVSVVANVARASVVLTQ